MPFLIKNIEASLYGTLTGSVNGIKMISADIQLEDYIDIGSSIFYLQNLTKTELTVGLRNPTIFGLHNARNIPVVELLVSYE